MKSNRLERKPVDASAKDRPLIRFPRRVILSSLLFVAGLSCLTGCAPFRGLRENLTYNDAMNDFVMGWRNSAWARQAWHDRKFMYVDEPQFYSFGEGFRDGYADVAGGGNGCVPALPPRKFWTWKYQTGEGQAKVAAWFAGYPYGAAAAKEDGAGNFQQIQVSHLIEAQYSPEFQKGNCPGCVPTMMPYGPEMESIPPGSIPGQLGSPSPALPPPAQNPTTQAMPLGDWPHESVASPPQIGPSQTSLQQTGPHQTSMFSNGVPGPDVPALAHSSQFVPTIGNPN